MIRLHQFPTDWGLPNLSPFCMKVETWLKLAGLPYEVVVNKAPNRAPLGKLPVVEDGGRKIPDSHTILDELARSHGVKLDDGLTAAERATALAFTRLCSEHLYWAVVYTRWGEDAGWNAVRPVFFGFLPGPVQALVAALVRRGTLKQLRGHGLGRHPPEEILRRGAQDLGAIADFLGDKPFMFGERPTSLDATVYAFVANVLDVPIDSALKRAAAARPNLVAYCRRMKARCFPEAKAA
jgi:glutathione S-transferase